MIDPDTFRSVLGRFASGVTILTACDDLGRDHGMTVSAFSSLSLEPPLVLFCVDHAAAMHEMLLALPPVGISILAAPQEAYSRRFADEEGRDDRFDGLAYARGESGVVLIDNALAHLECRTIAHVEGGDHTIFIAAVNRAEPRKGRPLLYYRGGYAQLER